MKPVNEKIWIPIFFGLAACSWMPHLSCHYYRIETNSPFIVGNFSYSITDSLISIGFYSILILFNLISISFAGIRITAALASGFFHLFLAVLHVIRLFSWFPFIVFGYS